MHLDSSTLLVIFGIILVSVSDTTSFKRGLLNLRYKPVTINVDSENTEACSVSKLLYLEGKASALTFLINTGQSIQTNNQVREVDYITNGPLGDEIYKYVSFNYYWASNSTNGVTGTTIDKKGFPYGVRVFCINEKYATFEEAVQHKNGLAELVFLFKICSFSSIPFYKISEKIQKLAKAGSFTPVTLETHITSVDYVTTTSSYFTYTGKFLDRKTNKSYACSTVIIFEPNTKACITQNQFNQTFSHLKDFSRKPLANKLTHDSSEIKTSRCTGVIQKVIP